MVLPALGPEPTRRGSIHGGVAGHFLHGVAPSATTSTSVGPAAALALACAATLLLLSVPYLVCSCYCYCSRCCSRSCSCLRCCSDLPTLHSDAAGVKEEPTAAGRGAHRRGTPLSVLGFRMGAVVAGSGGALAGRWRGDRRRKSSARGGLEGWPGRRRTGGGELFWGGEAALGPAVRLVLAGGSGGAG